MAADRHLEFWKFGTLVTWPVLERDSTLSYKISQISHSLRYTKRWFSIWRPSAILNLQNFSILLSSWPWKHNLHLHTKFRWNRMISGRDIAITVFSRWRPSAILNFQNFGILLSSRPWKHNLHLHTKFRWNRMISGWDSDKTIFKMTADRHLEFSKFGVLVIWPVLERDSALSYKISR